MKFHFYIYKSFYSPTLVKQMVLIIFQINNITLWTFQTNEDEESYPVVVTSDACYGDVTEIKVNNMISNSEIQSFRIHSITIEN